MSCAARFIRSACRARSGASNGPSCLSHWASITACHSCAGTAASTRRTRPCSVDLPNSRFDFFFIELWPQEIYYLTGLLILAAMALFLINAVAGRVWCGYLCPQTVWTDLFQTIERWVEGDRREHLQRDAGPWSSRPHRPPRLEAFSLADGRLVDRRRVGALLRRRADVGEGPGDPAGTARLLTSGSAFSP